MSRSVRATTEATRQAFAASNIISLLSDESTMATTDESGNNSAASSGGGAALDSTEKVDFEKYEDITRFVRDIHGKSLLAKQIRDVNRLRETLHVSRDEVLRKARNARAKKRKSKRKRKGIFPRLPANACVLPPPLALCLPCTEPPPPPENNANESETKEQSIFSDNSDEVQIVDEIKVNKKIKTEHTIITKEEGEREKSNNGKKDNKKKDQILVRMRAGGVKGRVLGTSSASPVLYLEGTHEPRPPSSATIFLKTHYATEDEQNLTFVPYFGDDDKEDVVSELFDIGKRQRMVEFGAEYRERGTNQVIDEILRLIVVLGGDALVKGGKDAQMKVNEALADAMDVRVDRITDRFRICFPSRCDDIGMASPSLKRSRSYSVGSEASSSVVIVNSNETSNGNNGSRHHSVLKKSDVLSTPTSPGGKSPSSRSRHSDGSVASSPNPTSAVKNSDTAKPTSYEHIMDSYRDLFCRRCFTYDCNMHGNLPKPNIELQGELAVVKEQEGHWDEIDGENNNASFINGISSNSVENNQPQPQTQSGAASDNIITKSPGSKRKRPRTSISFKETKEGEELSSLQKSVCERSFLVFQGDIDKIACAINAKPHLVKSFVKEQGIKLREPALVPDKKHGMDGKKSKGSRNTSMKNYNPSWLKRFQDAEIHPLFIPCDHDGPCNEDNCSCVKNAFFCTKHCVWGAKSRNFFRGCACKGNQCRTKSCSCFAAKRECDPDLCRTCGACTDPPNQPATKQKCRNDNIGMRRHCHLLLAKSSIEDAGWGVYTKHGLKKGDFVHEYVGEVISQEEAERRGRIYDKVNRSYLFNLTSDYVVDASRKGNKTKFANHSSKPNCYTRMINVNGDTRIGLFAKEDIEPQSELFFDYRYDVGMDNDLIIKPGKTVDWMKNPKMANKISKKYA